MPLTEPGAFPKPSSRVWSCPKDDPACSRTHPCRSCLGRRSRRSGLKKQNAARKALGIPDPRYRGQMASEESWRGLWRHEVKSGSQVGPIATRFLAAEAQSETNHAVGDGRPFAMVAMPSEWSDGLVIVRLSDWQAHVG